MSVEIETTDHKDAALRALRRASDYLGDYLGSPEADSLQRDAQVYALLAVADRIEALTERLESLLDAGLDNIVQAIDGITV